MNAFSVNCKFYFNNVDLYFWISLRKSIFFSVEPGRVADEFQKMQIHCEFFQTPFRGRWSKMAPILVPFGIFLIRRPHVRRAGFELANSIQRPTNHFLDRVRFTSCSLYSDMRAVILCFRENQKAETA